MAHFSILEQVLVVERHRQRVAEKSGGNFSVPALGRRKSSPEQGPFLVTNARGQFTPTRLASDGFVNYGFSLSPLEEGPDLLLPALYASAAVHSLREGWQTRCSTVQEAMTRLRGWGVEPRNLILPASLLREVCGPEVQAVESGYVATIAGGVRVFVEGLPEGAALVLPTPTVLGVYTRVDDYVGIMLQRANRTVMVVGRGMA